VYSDNAKCRITIRIVKKGKEKWPIYQKMFKNSLKAEQIVTFLNAFLVAEGITLGKFSISCL